MNVRAPLAGVLCVVLATPAPGAAPRYAWAREDGSVHLAITTLRVVGTLRQGAEAVPGATLEVSADEDFTLKLHTDEEARFRAVVPRPARYMVVAHLPDQRRQVVLWNLADARPGEELQRDIVVTPRWLKGKVVNQAGAPLPTARVTYRARDVARGEEVMGEAAVRQDGSFAVPLEEQKGLELHVGGVDGFLPASFLWPSSPPEEVTVVLEEGVDVRGVVVDGAGRPQQATVAVVADLFETGGPRTPASADGTFRFTTPRNATVVAWSSDGVAWAHAQEKLELRLAPPWGTGARRPGRSRGKRARPQPPCLDPCGRPASAFLAAGEPPAGARRSTPGGWRWDGGVARLAVGAVPPAPAHPWRSLVDGPRGSPGHRSSPPGSRPAVNPPRASHRRSRGAACWARSQHPLTA